MNDSVVPVHRDYRIKNGSLRKHLCLIKTFVSSPVEKRGCLRWQKTGRDKNTRFYKDIQLNGKINLLFSTSELARSFLESIRP